MGPSSWRSPPSSGRHPHPAARDRPAAAGDPLPPVVVEGGRAPDERTRTETEAREELRRVPGGTEVVGQQTIEQSRAANLKDALDFVPGVFVQPRFGARTRARSRSAAPGSAATSTCAASTS